MEPKQAQIAPEQPSPDSASAPVNPRDALRQRLQSFNKDQAADSAALPETADEAKDNVPPLAEGEEGTDPETSLEDSNEQPEGEDEGEASAHPEITLTADAVYLIDGEEVSGEEIKHRLMRTADYTRKTQELAARRKEVDAEREQYAQSVAFFEQANQSALKQYKELNWQELMASKPAEYQQRHGELQQLLQRQQQIEQAKGQFLEQLKSQRESQRKQAAMEAVEKLKGIFPNWGNELYRGLGETAEQYGFSRDEFNDYTDHRIMQLLHDAGQYRKAQLEAKKAIQRKPSQPPVNKHSNRDGKLSTEQAKRMNLQKKAKHGDPSANTALLRDRLSKRFGRT